MTTLDSIRNLTERMNQQIWAGNYFGPDGALALSKKRLELLKTTNGYSDHELSGISSLRYSLAGHALTKAKKYKVWWLLIGIYNLYLALKASNQLEKKIGKENLLPNELDVRSSILMKCGKYAKAYELIQQALQTQGITATTEALVLCNAGECLHHLKKYQESGSAYESARRLIPSIEPAQAVRVYRALANHHLRANLAQMAYVELKKAIEIIERPNSGLEDQLLKLQPLRLKIENALRN